VRCIFPFPKSQNSTIPELKAQELKAMLAEAYKHRIGNRINRWLSCIGSKEAQQRFVLKYQLMPVFFARPRSILITYLLPHLITF
jgi:hypothetical protein